MAFKGAHPKSQPRTLRTIAESKGTTPSGFSGATDEPGVPPATAYKDVAENSIGPGSPPPNAKQPFANLK